MKALVVQGGIVLVLAGTASIGSAQPAQEATDPLQCWWRASAGAIRVGETFSLVLTCAVVDTEDVRVVPDQAPLDPKVIQLPPLEVVGGSHPPDLRADDRRFFQYEYQLRLIGEDLFGKDLELPETKITYRVQTRVSGAAVEGRELTYVLPPMALRVLSMVPTDATDIRDATTESFGDVDARVFRGNLLRTIGGILFVLAGFSLVPIVIRLATGGRSDRPATERLIGDSAVLGSVGRELSAVRRDRQGAGWTQPLASRLATALRIAAGYALAPPASQTPMPSANSGLDGHLLVRTRWPRRRSAVVTSPVTPYTLAQERTSATGANGARRPSDAEALEDLEIALGRVTTAQYGRETVINETEMDEALETGARAARRLRLARLWPVQKVSRLWRR